MLSVNPSLCAGFTQEMVGPLEVLWVLLCRTTETTKVLAVPLVWQEW